MNGVAMLFGLSCPSPAIPWTLLVATLAGDGLVVMASRSYAWRWVGINGLWELGREFGDHMRDNALPNSPPPYEW